MFIVYLVVLRYCFLLLGCKLYNAELFMKFALIFTFAAFLLQKGLELSTLVGLRLSSEGGLLRHSECTVHN